MRLRRESPERHGGGDEAAPDLLDRFDFFQRYWIDRPEAQEVAWPRRASRGVLGQELVVGPTPRVRPSLLSGQALSAGPPVRPSAPHRLLQCHYDTGRPPVILAVLS